MREEFVFYEISSFEKSADGQDFKFESICQIFSKIGKLRRFSEENILLLKKKVELFHVLIQNVSIQDLVLYFIILFL